MTVASVYSFFVVASMALCGYSGAGRAADSIDTLIQSLGNKDWVKRSEAFDQLVELGEVAVPRLLAYVDDKSADREMRRWSLRLLSEIAPGAAAVPVLKRVGFDDPGDAPGDHRPAFRTLAFRALEKVGAPAVPTLIAGLRHHNDSVRTESAYTLMQLGKDAKPAMPELIQMLKKQHPGEWSRQFAARALGAIGPEAKQAVPILAEALKEKGGFFNKTPEAAAWALGEIGPEARAAIPDLCKALESWNPFLSAAAASALGKVAPGNKDTIAPLIKALTSSSTIVRRAAVNALVSMGADAKEAIPTLMAEIKGKKDPGIIPEFAAAVSQIDPSKTLATVPALIDALADKSNWLTRASAATVLGIYGPVAREAIPALNAALEDQHEAVRNAARKALEKVSPKVGDKAS
jgi:HEAT repeat protein